MFPSVPTLYVVEASVSSVDLKETYASVDLYGCVFYAHDEEVLLSDTPAAFALPQITATIKTSHLKYTPLKVSDKPIILLVECGPSGAFIQSNSNIENSLDRIDSDIDLIESLIEKGLPISKAFGDAKRSIEYVESTVLRYNFAPVSITRSDAIERVASATERLVELSEGYVPTKKNSDSTLSNKQLHRSLVSSKTERTGLKNLYVESSDKSDEKPVYVCFTGSLTETQLSKTGDNNRITYQDVEIRSYDSNVPFDQSPVIEKLSHLNIFVDAKTLKYIQQRGSNIPTLGRLIYYRRRDDDNAPSFDFSLQIRQWAPIQTWFDRIDDTLEKWQIRLAKGNLLKSRKYLDKITSLMDLFANPDNLSPDISVHTIDGVMTRYHQIETKINEVRDQYESLAKEKDQEEALFRLSMEAIEYLKNN